jgi:nucleotide-binding universal stress UspA family protein
VDVIVMSTHGRSGISRMVMGSVASKVATTTHRPVVLVKDHHSAAQTHERAA